MRKLLSVVAMVAGLLSVGAGSLKAEDAFLKLGPLELAIPFKTANVTYMYDFNANKNLVGGETVIATLWGKVEGTAGVVTSLDGQGAPFLGGNILIGNLLERWVSLPEEFKIGGFGGYDFRADSPMYGLKASIKIW